ncbi:Lipid A export ATP-binding/permease protein MsbA [compost metagenome]
MRAACEAAGVMEAIAALPQGFDTPLEGLRFSPLEWQRFALARALLRKPDLLILDEATSALDSQAEQELLSSLRQAAGGCTVLLVTPRLATVEHADQIVVLVDGSVVERGSHAMLSQSGGAYARMWQKQSGFIPSGSGSIGVQPERLAQLGMFESLEPGLLAEMASRFQTERFPAKRVVFHEGDRGERFYLLVRGSVEVIRATPKGGVQALARLEDGDPFGEMALTTDAPRSATIRTLTPCEFVTLAREDFLELLARDAAFESRMTRLVAERTGETPEGESGAEDRG